MKAKKISGSWKRWGGIGAGLLVCMAAAACGPDFPNYILDEGTKDLLLAPIADFKRELQRMQLRPTFTAIQTTNQSYAADSLQAEMAELRQALRKSGVSVEESNRIVEDHRAARQSLLDYVSQVEHRKYARDSWDGSRDSAPTNLPALPQLAITAGLPGEFADYFRGAVLWHDAARTNKAEVRAAWEQLLARPPGERKFKSTWAAYMLGRAWLEESPERAREYFQQVRTLARKGFNDPLGLAAASFGQEAKSHFDHTNLFTATSLYVEQFLTGDETALASLCFTIERALSEADAATLQALATNAICRRAVTAFLISREPSHFDDRYAPDSSAKADAANWLQAVERADAKDVASAEMLALAAYRAGEFEVAQRWVDRAKSSPTAQWLQAKLLLRAGKPKQAATLLSQLSHSFPTEIVLTNAPSALVDNLFSPARETAHAEFDSVPGGRLLRAEFGALQLARREFQEALDTLLRAEFWLDAAYVAEQVLTTDELKSYVEANWPAATLATTADREQPALQIMGERIRYLLARRLTREKRGGEAREFYPAMWQPQFDRLLTGLEAGADESLPTEQRARSLWSAAIIARTNGLELLGTELAPDWRAYGGDFEGSLTIETRTNESFGLVRASEAEAGRASKPPCDPAVRFHYRWQAAYLGWAAAQLLPNNSDETALVLCRSGTWLKSIDIEMADYFYKSLVRRCRKTPLGQEADRIRWFPRLDENGQWIPRVSPTLPAEPVPAFTSETGNSPDSHESLPEETNFPTEASNYRDYYVQAGDTVISILHKSAEAGNRTTFEEFMVVNPGLQCSRLVIGQRVRIPIKPLREP